MAVNREALAWISAFEARLEDESAVGRLLRPAAQRVLSGWLGAGNERVYVGREGWLFYRPDVEYATGPGFLDPAILRRRATPANEYEVPPQPDPRAAIRQFARDLSGRGITLILMPTPVKPTIHPAWLAPGAEQRPGGVVHNASFAPLVADLRRDGILVFDPSPLLARGRDEGEPQYLATDTHWRPDAMQRVAEALAAFIRAETTLPAAPPAGYEVERREARQTGDTALMLDLPRGQTLYPPERVELRFVVDAAGDPWRSTRSADILLLGDSFTNIYSVASMGWGEAAGLAEQLSAALQRPLDRIVQNDRGAAATRELLARDPGRLAGTRVVVWQFAARELAFGDWKSIALPDLGPAPR